MKQIHNQEKQQFKKLFKQEHIDNFEDRFKILEVFLRTEHHVTPSELADLLSKHGYKFELDFVRETLKLMRRFGFAQSSRFDDGRVRYEHRHLCERHDHMICTKCNNIIEFQNDELEELQMRIAADFGFHILQHRMEIYGICSKCLKDRTQLMPLVMAKQGEQLIIKDFTGGSGSHMRLVRMGLRPGDKIDVVTNMGSGQLVIAIDCKRYALGRGLAKKILVQPADSEKFKHNIK